MATLDDVVSVLLAIKANQEHLVESVDELKCEIKQLTVLHAGHNDKAIRSASPPPEPALPSEQQHIYRNPKTATPIPVTLPTETRTPDHTTLRPTIRVGGIKLRKPLCQSKQGPRNSAFWQGEDSQRSASKPTQLETRTGTGINVIQLPCTIPDGSLRTDTDGRPTKKQKVSTGIHFSDPVDLMTDGHEAELEYDVMDLFQRSFEERRNREAARRFDPSEFLERDRTLHEPKKQKPWPRNKNS